MEDYTRLIFVLTDLVAPLVIGYILHQKGIINEKLIDRLVQINIIGLATFLSLLSFWVMPLSPALLILPFFGILYVLVPGIFGLLFSRRFHSPLDRGAYTMSAMLGNLGTLGGVCAFILFSETGFAYTQIIVTFQNMLLVILCFPLAHYFEMKQVSKSSGLHIHFSFKEMFLTKNQLALVGMFAGLVLDIGGIPRPAVFADVFQVFVHAGAWIAMLPVGCLIDFSRARHFYKSVLSLIPLRFLLTPAVIYLLAWVFFDDPVLLTSMLVLATAPTAINAVLTCRIYKLNVDMAVASFLSTTAIYLAAIFPLIFVWAKLQS